MRITTTSAGVAAHFAWQHDRPHVWDGLMRTKRAFRQFRPDVAVGTVRRRAAAQGHRKIQLGIAFER